MPKKPDLGDAVRSLGLIVVIGLSLFAILAIGGLIFFPAEPPPRAVIRVPVDPSIGQMEQALADQESAYQARLTGLQQTLEQQEARYQTQIEELEAQIAAAQQQLDDLKSTEQTLSAQVQTLETTRAERQAIYQADLQQSRTEHGTRQTELRTQLDRVQAELGQISGRLER